MEKQNLAPGTKISSVFFTLASIALTIFGLIFFSSLIKPFVIAFLIWFIINQLKESLGKISIKGKRIPSSIRSTTAFLIIILIVYFISAILTTNIGSIAESMPKYIENLNKSIEKLSSLFDNPMYANYLKNWVAGLNLAGLAASIVNSFSQTVVNIAIILVYVIFFLLEDSDRKLKLVSLFQKRENEFNKFKNSIEDIKFAIRAYLWQKTAISLITAVVSFIILLFLKVDYAFLWAFLIFMFNFIPYIGPLISSLLPGIFAMLVTNNPMQFVIVFGAMESVQIVLGNFVEPKMMGKGTNIGPVIVILALAFWGMIWGITGMLLAVPITAVLVIILSKIPSTRNIAILLSEKGEIIDLED